MIPKILVQIPPGYADPPEDQQLAIAASLAPLPGSGTAQSWGRTCSANRPVTAETRSGAQAGEKIIASAPAA